MRIKLEHGILITSTSIKQQIMTFRIIKLTLLLALVTNITYGQGINFLTGLSWEQVKAKARAENKYIFVDVGATWCVPCRKMELEVFPLKSVGDVYNSKFISIQVQADETSNDSKETQNRRSDARQIVKNYKISGYPTYLYFSPDGELVSQSVGVYSSDGFNKLADAALDPTLSIAAQKKKYEKLKNDYVAGRLNAFQKKELADWARFYREISLADSVAKNYYESYLNKLSGAELITNDNLKFISDFPKVLKSSDSIFIFVYNHPKVLDDLKKIPGVSQKIINYVIDNEEIKSQLYEGNKPKNITPNWDALYKTISEKYTKDLATLLLLRAKENWYTKRKDWQLAIEFGIQRRELEGLDTVGLGSTSLNNYIYNILLVNSNDKVQIKKGISWIKVLLHSYPNEPSYLDTYAWLIYKLGRKKEAIKMQEETLDLIKRYSPSYRDEYYKELYENLQKMKLRKPFWIQ